MNTKQNATKKAAGFYVGLVAAVLCVAAGVIYGTKFSAIAYKETIYDPTICTLLYVTAAIGVVLLFIPKVSFLAPVVLCLGSGCAIMMYIHMIIWPISDTIYGIEPFTHMNELITCAVLLVLAFLLSEVSLYTKKVKEVKAA